MAIELVKQHCALRHLQSRKFPAKQSQAICDVVKINIDSAEFNRAVAILIQV